MYLSLCVWLLFPVLVPLIFPFGFLQTRFGWLALVCVGACVCCGGGHFCTASPMKFASFVGKSKLLVFSMFGGCLLLRFSRISTKMRTFENPGGNLHRLHRRGLWCAKPKCSQRWPLANLAWASPLANSLEIALSNVWRLVCTNRYGFCTDYNRDWDFQKSNFKKQKNKNFMWGGAMLFKHLSWWGGAL